MLFLKGKETDSKFQLTKDDQLFLKSKLPELLEKESRRKKQEEKEKQEKIQQLKAGDPKDMTVILLREVLLEMGLLFKSSDSKQKLIEKATLARSSLNSTRTICAMASVIERHAQPSTDDAAQLAHRINFAGHDCKINTSWQTAFLPDTREQLQVSCLLR